MTRKITAAAAVLALLATGCSASTDSSAPGGTLIYRHPLPQLHYYSCTRNHHRRPHPHRHRGHRLPERDGKHHRGIHHCDPDPDREP